MPKVMYVGNKPFEKDSKAGTGVVWTGKGDIQDVPGYAVPKLIRYADVWKLVEGDNLEIAESIKHNEASKAQSITEELDMKDLSLRIQDMGKDQLEEVAQKWWNVSLDKRRSVAALREEVMKQIDRFGLPG
jgi:hypothetical protein